MATTMIDIIKELRQRNLSLLTADDLQRLFHLDNQQSLYKRIQRLETMGIIKTIIKGKYRFMLNTVNDFLLANFLYQPSYISLESALSFYSIITGFTRQITSITIKKTRSIETETKNFLYSQIAPSLYWGFEKKDDFLIADREKSLLDYVYLGIKGLRTINFDEFDLSLMNKKKLEYYAKKINNKRILEITKNLFHKSLSSRKAAGSSETRKEDDDVSME